MVKITGKNVEKTTATIQLRISDRDLLEKLGKCGLV